MLSKLSSTISIWLSRSSSSINRSPLRCKLTWFKTPEFSRNSKDHSIISLRSAREVSPMSSLLLCTAEFTLQVKSLSLTRVMSRRCTSSDKVSSRYSTMKTMRSPRRSQFSTCQSSPISEITKSCPIWNPTLSSRLCLQTMRMIELEPPSQCQISFLCASQRMSFLNSVTCSHKLLKTSREDLSREDKDSCFKRTLIPRDMMTKWSWRRMLAQTLSSRSKMALTMRCLLMSSTLMKSQRTLSLKRRIWRCTWTSWTRESITWLMLLRRLIPRWHPWKIRKPLWTRSTARKRTHLVIERKIPSLRCSRTRFLTSLKCDFCHVDIQNFNNLLLHQKTIRILNLPWQ